MADAKTHILVVDDEPAIRYTLNLMLRHQGYEVTIASSGEEALALMQTCEFDLLLLDLKLPGISGLEVARYASTYQPDAAVLIMTGSNELQSQPDDGGLQAFALIHKTANPQDVLAQIAVALAQRQPQVLASGGF